MRIESLQFGRIEFDQERVLGFPEGLLGLPHLTRFLHVRPEGWEPVAFLLPIDQPARSFPVLDPYLIEADYAVEPSVADRDALGLTDGGDLLVLAVVTFGSSVGETTLNLLAPVLINAVARRGRQVVLEGSGYSVAAPVFGGGE